MQHQPATHPRLRPVNCTTSRNIQKCHSFSTLQRNAACAHDALREHGTELTAQPFLRPPYRLFLFPLRLHRLPPLLVIVVRGAARLVCGAFRVLSTHRRTVDLPVAQGTNHDGPRRPARKHHEGPFTSLRKGSGGEREVRRRSRTQNAQTRSA